MADFNVELDVFNSGSPNDRPAKGAASECYLAVVPSRTEIVKLRVGSFSNNDFTGADIRNGGIYKNFVDTNNRNTNVNSLVLPIDDANLMVCFSIYYGTRWFDALLNQAIDKYLTAQFSPGLSSLVDKLPNLIQHIANDVLTKEEKQLLAQFDKSIKEIVVPVGFGKVGRIASPTAKTVVPIYSVIDVVHDEILRQPVIHAGDHVADMIITPA